MDIASEKIGMNSIAFRMKNLLENGDVNAIGETMRNVTINECIERTLGALQRAGVEEHLEEGKWKVGVGFAISKEQCDVSFPSMAYARLLEDGAVEISTSATDPGEGIHTVIAQIAAEEMQVPLENIKLVTSDTRFTPVGTGASGSRQTSQMGKAVKLACADLKEKMLDAASSKLKVSRSSLLFDRGKIRLNASGDGSGSLDYTDLFNPGPMGGAYVPGEGVLAGKALYFPKTGDLDPETGQCSTDRAVAYYTPVAQGARVGVNVETGQVKILQYVGAVDVGKAINPLNVIGQNEGAIAMGLNGAMNEEIVLVRGKVLNPDLKDYKLQSIMEYFPITSIILENPGEEGPYGARGCGEAPIDPVAAVLANAVYDAVKVRIKDLPITPEKILLELKRMKKR
jgi:carbon-monoxide dehydrogenase large subunit